MTILLDLARLRIDKASARGVGLRRDVAWQLLWVDNVHHRASIHCDLNFDPLCGGSLEIVVVVDQANIACNLKDIFVLDSGFHELPFLIGLVTEVSPAGSSARTPTAPRTS